MQEEHTIETPFVKMYPDGRMDTKNAALYLGLEEKTLAMKRSYGTGPRYIKPGRIYYYKKDLDAWIREAKKASSTAQMRVLKQQT
ncbi:helix-turn-helix transcriptional regulator [Desulfosediminicola ganghwensis]|uniref:helix-turn-helix transcriptional regulator n=1 Tax=Desulfosediminicola ganghwensis TaxID=2569540 RepID=UPI0010AD7730|nr:helix-turn-helix domain-containing protein [Desulfosediminicola ganghwensis]